ncbi:MAG: hypothetical protein R2941_15600 [Desulfobacterales bacterium]
MYSGNSVSFPSGFSPVSIPDWKILFFIDGSMIKAVLSIYWADYRSHGIPSAIFLTAGNRERPFVSRTLSAGQTGVMDRGYQCHKLFESLRSEKKSFVCRIKSDTTMECIIPILH